MKNPYAAKFLEGFNYSSTFWRALTPDRWKLATALSTRAETLRINLRSLKESDDLKKILDVIEETWNEVQTLRNEKTDYIHIEFVKNIQENNNRYALFKQVEVGFHRGTFEDALFKGLENMMQFALKPNYRVKNQLYINEITHKKYLDLWERINTFQPVKRDIKNSEFKEKITSDFYSIYRPYSI